MIFDDYSEEAQRRHEERVELRRRAAQSVIDEADAGRNVDPLRLAWAQQFLRANLPLQRPLGTGDPHA